MLGFMIWVGIPSVIIIMLYYWLVYGEEKRFPEVYRKEKK